MQIYFALGHLRALLQAVLKTRERAERGSIPQESKLTNGNAILAISGYPFLHSSDVPGYQDSRSVLSLSFLIIYLSIYLFMSVLFCLAFNSF